MWGNLPDDVKAELADGEYSSRTHGTPACYAKGCRGPLCLKSERDKQAHRRKRDAEASGRDYIPYGPHPVRERDELLEKITAWHRGTRSLPLREAEAI